MSLESLGWVALFFSVAGIFTLINMLHKQQAHLRCLDIKLDAVLKAQGIEWSFLSAKVQSLALDGQKIVAIKLHRAENPALSLAEAKSEIEAFALTKH